MFLADNVRVPEVCGDLVTRQGVADTFKRRRLANGSKYEVLKNYFDAEEIRQVLGLRSLRSFELDVRFGKCFWWAKYITA